jgi:hypothetical protein
MRKLISVETVYYARPDAATALTLRAREQNQPLPNSEDKRLCVRVELPDPPEEILDYDLTRRTSITVLGRRVFSF